MNGGTIRRGPARVWGRAPQSALCLKYRQLTHPRRIISICTGQPNNLLIEGDIIDPSIASDNTETLAPHPTRLSRIPSPGDVNTL